MRAAEYLNPPLPGTLVRFGIALSLLVALAASAAARAAVPAAEAPADQEIEALLPPIEAKLRFGQSREAMAVYATRVDLQGRLLWAWSNPDDQTAWEVFHGLSTQESTSPWAHAGMARVYIHWKIWDQADAALVRASKLNPSVAEFWVLRGDLERLRGQPVRAEEAYLAALKLQPTPFAYDGLGLMAWSGLHADDARARFLAARALWPEDYVAARGLANLALAAQDWRGALIELERLHQLAPKDVGLRLESIEVRKKLGDSTGVTTDAEAAVRLGAHDPATLKLLLAGYQETGRADDELRVLKELESSGAMDAKGYRRLGEIEAAAGKEGEAQEHYQKAIALSPKDADVLRAQAHLRARKGKLVEAIDDIRQLQALGQEPGEELDAIVKSAALAPKPISGRNIAAINAALGVELNKLYRTLLAGNPALAGTMKLQVTVGADGKATAAEYRENTVASPELAANLYWNARDARYPLAPARYVFNFELHH